MTVLQSHSSNLGLNRSDAINLSLVRTILNHHSISRRKVQLLDTSGPSATLLNNLWVWLVQAVV